MTADAQQHGKWYLRTVRGSMPGQSFAIDRTVVTVGRDPINDIAIDEPSVSRQHAQLAYQDGWFHVQDSAGLNGIVINGVRIDGPQRIAPGQEVVLSRDVAFVLEWVPGPQQTAAKEFASDATSPQDLYNTPTAQREISQQAPGPPQAVPQTAPQTAPAATGSRMRWLFGGCGLVLLLMAIVGIAGALMFTGVIPNPLAAPTNTPTYTPAALTPLPVIRTLTPIPTSTATAQAAGQPTPTPYPTYTSYPTNTPAPTPTATFTATAPPTETPTVTLTQTATITQTATPTPLQEVGATKVRDKDGAVMVYVPSAEFSMGSTDEDIDAVMAACGDCVRKEFTREQPQHKVRVGAFWIDRTEVTNAQFRQCVADGACSPPSSLGSHSRDSYYDNPEFDNHPVVFVTWFQAQEYARWAGGRLPTEAEWEYAARGPDRRTYPWGNGAPNGSLLNFNWNVGDTTAVGSYPDGASWCGTLDMAGNVWEWVSSSFRDYPYSADDGRETVASGQGVHRGGAFAYEKELARGAYRSLDAREKPWSTLGIRVVVSAVSP